MPSGGFRIAGPGKKIGRPRMDGRRKKINKSVTLYPDQWRDLKKVAPDQPPGRAVEKLLNLWKDLESAKKEESLQQHK